MCICLFVCASGIYSWKSFIPLFLGWHSSLSIFAFELFMAVHWVVQRYTYFGSRLFKWTCVDFCISGWLCGHNVATTSHLYIPFDSLSASVTHFWWDVLSDIIPVIYIFQYVCATAHMRLSKYRGSYNPHIHFYKAFLCSPHADERLCVAEIVFTELWRTRKLLTAQCIIHFRGSSTLESLLIQNRKENEEKKKEKNCGL